MYTYNYTDTNYAVNQILEKCNLDFQKKEHDDVLCTQKEYLREDYLIEETYYTIIIYKYTGNSIIDKYNVEKLKNQISLLGELLSFQILSNDILITIKQGDYVGALPLRLFNLVINMIDKNYTGLYAQNITLDNINNTYYDILNYLDSTYFISNQLVNYNTIVNQDELCNFNKLKNISTDVIKSIFECDKDKCIQSINDILLVEIKNAYDLKGLEFFREFMCITFSLINKITNTVYITNTDFSSIEEEAKEYITYCLNAIDKIYAKNITDYTYKSIMFTIDNFSDCQLSLNEMAKNLSITKMHLSRLFKKDTNVTYLYFLQEIRMFWAKQYLIFYNIKVKDISKKVGYEDSHYFAKLFKKNTLLTPKEFKHTKGEVKYEGIVNSR